jgi:ribosomal protein L16/L10AE
MLKFKKIHKYVAVTTSGGRGGPESRGRTKKLSKMLNPSCGWDLSSSDFALVKASHLEMMRRFLARQTQRKGKIFRKCELTLPMTKKGAQSRMGKGCGKVKYWVGLLRPGQFLYEIKMRVWMSKLSESKGLLSKLSILNKKLPFRLKLSKHNVELSKKERWRMTCVKMGT